MKSWIVPPFGVEGPPSPLLMNDTRFVTVQQKYTIEECVGTLPLRQRKRQLVPPLIPSRYLMSIVRHLDLNSTPTI